MPEASKWAILIGIDQYHESLGALKYAARDCRRLAEVLKSDAGGYASDRVLILADDEATDQRPTYANIHSWLASWLAQPEDDDTVFVFFAGHGREMSGKCYLVPGDATLQTLHVTGIPVPYVQELLDRCRARQKILVLDACHSGAGRDVVTMSAGMLDDIAAAKGIYTITSCDAAELSHEWAEKGHGVFSYYLAEALAGSCPFDLDGRLTLDGVYEWTHARVREWARAHRAQQTPKRVCKGTGQIILNRLETNENILDVPVSDEESEAISGVDRLLESKGIDAAIAYAREVADRLPLSYAVRKRIRDLGDQQRRQHAHEAEQAAARRKQHIEKLERDAHAFEQDGDVERAIACLKEALLLPDGRHLRVRLESLERHGSSYMSARDKARELGMLFESAHASENDDPEAASACYERILAIHPNNPRAKQDLMGLQNRLALRKSVSLVIELQTSVQEDAGASLQMVQQLQQEQTEYQKVGMTDEAAAAEEEIRKLQLGKDTAEQHLGRITELLSLLRTSQRIDTAAKKITGCPNAYTLLLQIASSQNDTKGLSLLNYLAPQLVEARADVLAWKEKAEATLRDGRRSYRKAKLEHKENVTRAREEAKRIFEQNKSKALEHARAQFEKEQSDYDIKSTQYRRTPAWQRLFITAPKKPAMCSPQVDMVKPKGIKAPVEADYVKLPSLPDCIRLLQPAIIKGLDAYLTDYCRQAVPWFEGWLKGDGIAEKAINKPSESKLTKEPAKSVNGNAATKRTRQVTDAFLTHLRQKYPQNTQECIHAEIASVADALLMQCNESDGELKVRGIGAFWYNRSHGHLTLEPNPQQGTSAILREWLRTQGGMSTQRSARAFRYWADIQPYCKTTGKQVQIQGIGVFRYSQQHNRLDLVPEK